MPNNEFMKRVKRNREKNKLETTMIWLINRDEHMFGWSAIRLKVSWLEKKNEACTYVALNEMYRLYLFGVILCSTLVTLEHTFHSHS